MSPYCLDKWRLIVAELDTDAEVSSGAELAGAAAARATRWRDGVIRSSSTCLLAGASVLARDENDRKRSIGGQITFVFTSFSRKRNRYDIVENEYGADIPIISKAIVVDRKIHR
jgi:hypothetical protein